VRIRAVKLTVVVSAPPGERNLTQFAHDVTACSGGGSDLSTTRLLGMLGFT